MGANSKTLREDSRDSWITLFLPFFVIFVSFVIKQF
jgi:hypothetical protein